MNEVNGTCDYRRRGRVVLTVRDESEVQRHGTSPLTEVRVSTPLVHRMEYVKGREFLVSECHEQ